MTPRKLFAHKLAEAWGVDELRLQVPTRTPLSEWAVPRTVESRGVRALNWAEWGVVPASQAAGLLELRGADPGFFLWKRASPDADMHFERVTEVPPDEYERYAPKLAEQTIAQMLRDEAREEKQRPLLASAKAAREKLRDAEAVLVTGDDATEGMLVVSPLDVLAKSFARPKLALERVNRLARGDSVVFLDVVLGNRCPSRQVATQLVEHVEATHPLGFLVVFAPPVVSTLRFYADLGFTYAADEGANDLLPTLVERLEVATKVWHSGFPWLTYLDPHIEDTRVRVSVVSEDDVPEPTHVDNHNADEGTDAFPNAFVWVSPGDPVDAVVHAAQGLLSTLPNDATFTLVATAPEDARRVLREARARPVPAFACTMASPVAETVEYEDFAIPNDEMGDVNDDGPWGDEAEMEVNNDEAGYEVQDDGPWDMLMGEDEEETLFYTRNHTLKRRVVKHAVAYALQVAGVKRRTLTAELRTLASETLDLPAVRKGEKGILLVEADAPVVTHACVYTLTDTTVRIVSAACPEDDEVSRLFALLLRLQWGEKRRVVGNADGCPSLGTYLQHERTSDLFEAAIPVETRRAFARACAIGAVSLCSAP